MKLKQLFTQEQLWLLDEELFHDVYYTIINGDWPFHTATQAKQFQRLSSMDRCRYALTTTEDYLQDLPDWELATYFSRYGSRHFDLVRGSVSKNRVKG
ncbi:hypothetical protein [Enterococcus diestrammenae]|uniref:hypothetical protein n=1 Tax=Enterococcus diestrammenae TaxID=1155073 RepID=UPI0022E80ABF|nr:hypothetical protein [Enterococcus diestrammenae]